MWMFTSSTLHACQTTDGSLPTTATGQRVPPGIDWPPTGADSNPTHSILTTPTGTDPRTSQSIRIRPAGTYSVGVHYYCEHSLQQMGAPTIDPGSGATAARVEVFCDGALIATYNNIMLGGTDDWVTVAELDYPSCAGRSVNDRTTGNEILLLNPANQFPRHCDLACSSDTDCFSNERCVRVGGGGPPTQPVHPRPVTCREEWRVAVACRMEIWETHRSHTRSSPLSHGISSAVQRTFARLVAQSHRASQREAAIGVGLLGARARSPKAYGIGRRSEAFG